MIIYFFRMNGGYVIYIEISFDWVSYIRQTQTARKIQMLWCDHADTHEWQKRIII